MCGHDIKICVRLNWLGISPARIFAQQTKSETLSFYSAIQSQQRAGASQHYTEVRNLHNRLFFDVLNTLISFMKTALIINIIFSMDEEHTELSKPEKRVFSFYFHL